MVRFFLREDISMLISSNKRDMLDYLEDINGKMAKCVFVYAYSIFESTITEILRYYLQAFPEKIDKDICLKKELLFTNNSKEILLDIVNGYIRKFSCNTLIEYLLFFEKTLSISLAEKNEYDVKAISMARNKIVHNNFEGNLSSMHQSGKRRADEYKEETIKQYVQSLAKLLDEIDDKITKKYNSYTKEKLARAIWDETFSTPLLNFDKIWNVDNAEIHIKNISEIKSNVQAASSSEKLLASLFFQQYNRSINDRLFKFDSIPMIVSLDSATIGKVIKILQFFEAYPYFYNGEKMEIN